MDLVVTEPVFGVSDQVRHNPACSDIAISGNIQTFDIESRERVYYLSSENQRRWSACAAVQLICAFVFRVSNDRFAHDAAQMITMSIDVLHWACQCWNHEYQCMNLIKLLLYGNCTCTVQWLYKLFRFWIHVIILIQLVALWTTVDR